MKRHAFRKPKILVTDEALEQLRIRSETSITTTGAGGVRITETPTEHRIKEELKQAARDTNQRQPEEGRLRLPG